MASLHKESYRLEELLPLMEERLRAGQSLLYSPRGVSMRPMLYEGRDRVTLSPLPEQLKKYDLPLYRRDDGKFILHRIIRAGETYTCCGDNQYTPEEGLERRQMIAVVTAFTHKGKTVPVTDPVYRLYCRFWCLTRPLRYYIVRAADRLRHLSGRTES